MALKCPECGTVSHTRTSTYESPTVKRTWYQCRNLDCSCTFTALESVEKIIMKPMKAAEDPPQITPERLPQSLNRYGAASKLSTRQNAPA